MMSVVSFAQTDENMGTIKVGNGGKKYFGNDTVYSEVNKMPSFSGGNKSLLKFIQKNSVYPNDEKEKGIKGLSMIQFIVQKNGTITNILLNVSSTNSFDKEAIRLVKSMPKWIPGECNNEKVAVIYYLPINFTY